MKSPNSEPYPCPTCGGIIQVVKMDFRLAARYTCSRCGNDVVLPADQVS